MKIIMLGAPGAGKGTQAKMIADKYQIPHISTGDIFRANIKNGTELGKEAKKYMDQGLLVPDELTVKILLDRVAQPDCANGYILDGMPRTIPQAEALEKSGIDIDCALSIEIADEVIIERMSGRRTCKECSQTFHIVSNPPKVEGKCDFCGGELTIRKDDAPETVLKRLAVYHASTEVLKDYYAKLGRLHTVNGNQSIEGANEEILKAIGAKA